MSIVELTSNLAEKYVEFKNQSHKESKYLNGTTLDATKELIKTYHADETKYALVATSGNEIVGQLFMVHTKDVLFIQLISVLEKEKGLGLANQLMDKAKSTAKQLDVERIELIVDKENDRAIAFYKKVGFSYAKDHGKKRLVYELVLREKKKPIYAKWK